MKKKAKKKQKNKVSLIILSVATILLLISNIYFIYYYNSIDKEEKVVEEVLFTKTDEPFNSNKKYYATIKYKKFKTFYKSDSVTTFAIVDTKSNTYNKFMEMINKTAFYKHTKIYVLEENKLSRKDEIAFYDLDERLPKLESNYIITVSNNKIISITLFDNENINKIIKGLGE